MSYHFLCKRGIRPARTEQFLVLVQTSDAQRSNLGDRSRYYSIDLGKVSIDRVSVSVLYTDKHRAAVRLTTMAT